MKSITLKFLLLVSFFCGSLGQHSFSRRVLSSSSNQQSQCSENYQCKKVTCGSWGYEGEHGLQTWSSVSSTCGNGVRQSPIDLSSSRSTSASMGPVNFSPGYNQALAGTWENTGEAAKFKPHDTTGLTITGGPLGESVYRLAQFHFHWGCNNNKGSEHTIEGRSFSMELHLVHYNTKYGNDKSAAAQPDGLVVAAIMFNADQSYPDFHPLKSGVLNLGCIQQSGSTYPGQFSLGDFIQTVNPIKYFNYLGSLTTPSCNESVNWVVFTTVIHINDKLVEIFRKLNNCECGFVCDNFRPVQNLGNRILKYNTN